MTALDWSRQQDRHYEYGVDRGVFYPDGGVGVAWPGLVQVNDGASGGDVIPFYLDGVKRQETMTASDYRGSIQSYASPPGFAGCEGEHEVVAGFYITRQMRDSFGFCYRTRLDETDYKIGLVWNATATKQQVQHVTQSDGVSPNVIEWMIEAIPPAAMGYRPTAHMVIQASKFGLGAIAALEDILYGTSTSTPRLPSQAELLGILDVIDGGTPSYSSVGILDGGTPASSITSGPVLVDGGSVSPEGIVL